MATEVERLVVSLEASITKYERAMQKALGNTNKTARRIESRFAKMSAVSNAAVGRILAPLAAAASLRGAQQLIDAAIGIENSLKVAGLEGEELSRVYERLLSSANRNVAPFEALTRLYGRAALAQNELNASTEDLLSFADNVAIALRVSGQSAEASRGALIQLSQAIGAGIVRAEEFNAILEGALPIAQATAAGLDEAGGSVAKLRRLIIDGKVSSEAFFRAFEAGSVILEEKLVNAEITVSQGFVRLQNVLIDTAKQFNEGTETSKILTDALEDTGDAVQDFADWLEFAIPTVGGFFKEIEDGFSVIDDFAKKLRDLTGLSAVGEQIANSGFGQFFGLESGRDRDAAAAAEAELQRRAQRQRVRQDEINVTIPGAVRDSVSLADYPIQSADNSGTTSTKATPAEKFADSLAAQQRRIDNLREETALQSGLNPIVDDYGYALTKLKTQQDLENDAVKAGLELTPARQAAIEQLAEGYANATVEAAKLTEEQDRARESMQEWFDLGRTAARGFIDDLVEGKTAAEALGNVFSQLGSKLIDLGLGGLFGTGNGNFGLIGQAFGFANGGIAANGKPKMFANGGVSRSAAIFGEAGPEAAVPLPDGRRIPVDLRMPSGGSGGNNITYAPQIDARGADTAAVVRLEQVLARDRVEFEGKVKRIVSRRQKDMW